jgi:hypothetical protein
MGERYYDYNKTATPYYAVHIALENYFSNMFFNEDVSRIVYASNDYAFRARSGQNKDESNLDFPFLNYRRTSWDLYEDVYKLTVPSLVSGIFIEELGAKVQLDPVVINFESTLWFSREDDMAYAYRLLRKDAEALTEIPFTLEIDNQEFDLWCQLDYETLEYDPDYNENDWLEQNHIHSISMDFSIKMFDLWTEDPSAGNFSITERVLFDYINRKNINGINNEVEAMSYLISELT